MPTRAGKARILPAMTTPAEEKAFAAWGRSEVEGFGKVLREMRLREGITQEALAARADTERSHISALERGEKGPALATILRLAAALNMPASELIGRVEEELKASLPAKPAGPRR